MRGRFSRPLGRLRYKRQFVIVAEGTVTEREYFALLDDASIVRVRCLKNKRSLPPQEALRCVEQYVKNAELRKGDEAWVVVDRDSWQEEHLDRLQEWAQRASGRGFALSNPKFEYWLLLHFEDGSRVRTPDDCDRRLKARVPDYDKHIHPGKFTEERIVRAVERARGRHTPPGWPRNPGTTVHLLVERILAAKA
jgi:hypothetical protein